MDIEAAIRAALPILGAELIEVASGYPVHIHGSLSADPFEAVKQSTDEIVAALRSRLSKIMEGG